MQSRARKSQRKTDQFSQIAEILDGFDDGFLALDRNWHITYANQRIARIMHAKIEDILGQNIWEKFPQILGTEAEYKSHKAMSENQPQEFIFFWTPTKQWYSIRIHPSAQGITVYWQDITQRKQVDEHLRESEELYRAIFENSLDAVLLTSPDGSIHAANAAACQMFGRSEEELLHTSRDKTADESDPRLTAALDELDRTGKFKGELTFKRKDGSTFPGDASIALFTDRDGNIRATMIIRDITNYKRAVEALQESEERLRLFVEKAPVSIAMFDTQMRYLAVSQRWLKDYHLTGPSVIGRSHYEVFPEIPQRWKEIHQRCLAGAVESAEEDPFPRADGSIQWLRWEIIPWYTVKNQVGGIIIFTEDITEYKHEKEALARAKDELEQRVKERTQALAESEEKYRLLVENANEAVVVFQDEREKFFNSKAIEISGYSREELATIPITEFIHPDDRSLVIERYLQRLQGQEAPSSYEFRMIHKDGTIMWVNLNAVLITWEGRPAILGLMTDITQRKNLEQELKDYAQKITRVQEEERKRIAYELHDDTAQYLSILKLQLDSLLHSGNIQDPNILEKLKFLEKDAGRAVDDVRRYSHELRPGVLEHLGLQAALDQIADDINKLGQLTVNLNVEGQEQKLSEDIKLGLFRIAQEALNNARKHAQTDQVNIDLTFSPDQVKLVVSDNGVGFDTRKAAHRSSLKGSLGLISMQERAKLIGASLKIESQPGKGTTVSVEVKIP